MKKSGKKPHRYIIFVSFTLNMIHRTYTLSALFRVTRLGNGINDAGSRESMPDIWVAKSCGIRDARLTPRSSATAARIYIQRSKNSPRLRETAASIVVVRLHRCISISRPRECCTAYRLSLGFVAFFFSSFFPPDVFAFLAFHRWRL